MPTEIIKGVSPQAGVDSSISALPLYGLPDNQYSDFRFPAIHVPVGFTGISSVKVFYKREDAGNLYLRFKCEHVDTDGVSSTTTDADSYTEYAGGGTDGKIASITVPPAVYDGLTVDSGDVVAFKIERDAADALDTYESLFHVAFIQVTLDATAAGAGVNDIVALATVKRYIGETSSANDDFLQDWITRISSSIERYTGRKFKEQTVEELHDGDTTDKLTTRFNPIIALSGTTDTDKLASLQTRPNPDTAWANIETSINQIFIDEFTPYIQLYDQTFPAGKRNIRVKYKTGYSVIPGDIEKVCIEMVAVAWKESKVSGEFRIGEYSFSENDGSNNTAWGALDLEPRWKATLDLYKAE